MFKPNQSRLIVLLLGVMIIVVVLFGVRYYFGVKTLRDSAAYLNGLENVYVNPQNNIIAPISRITDPKLGNSQTGQSIYLYADFECPYCADTFKLLYGKAGKNLDKYLLIWKDAVSGDHEQAGSAALAARCAQLQGKFWEYASYLFANQSNLGDALYQTISQKLNLDQNQFNQCYQNKTVDSLITANQEEVKALGLTATPTVFIGSAKFEGNLTQSDLDKLIK